MKKLVSIYNVMDKLILQCVLKWPCFYYKDVEKLATFVFLLHLHSGLQRACNTGYGYI